MAKNDKKSPTDANKLKALEKKFKKLKVAVLARDSGADAVAPKAASKAKGPISPWRPRAFRCCRWLLGPSLRQALQA